MKRTFVLALTIVSVGRSFAATPENPYTVNTFECIGIYYKVDSADPGDCKVNYRASASGPAPASPGARRGGGQWKAALDLWFDERDSEYRGSIFGLTPDTEYEIELVRGQQNVRFKTRTRSEEFKIGKTTYLDAGVTATTVRIAESGSQDGWHLVTPKPGGKTTIDPENTLDYNIVVEASFVIIRGLELKNAAIHGILIERGSHDVVIEDCDITFWGRIGGPISFGNTGGSDSAICAKEGTARLVIQRNLLHDPRGASNDWDTGHPSGPQAITLHNSRGGNIIRYNDIFSTEDHGFNDAFGGSSNFSDRGSPNRDSDIYGNIISNVWDDAIESEGANMNVRIWGNYLHHTFQHIATACTSKGPLYIFRNVFGLSRRTHKDPLGGSMIKVGQRDQYGGGRRYVFHNTALQPKGAFRVFSSHTCPNTITRNNIFDCPGPLTGSRQPDPPSDFDYDVFTGLSMGQDYERHGIRRDPAFVRSHRLEFYLAPTISTVKWGRTPTKRGDRTIVITDKVITIPNPAIDAGVLIPGFNDDYKGKAPDMGAFERGNPPLKFGRDAQAGIAPAPWEEF